MHSCGLRTCEVRRLRPKDIDFDGATIQILWSKGNRSRRLAVTDEIMDLIADCDTKTAKTFGSNRQYMFVTSTGGQVGAASVGQVFSRIWTAAGLPESKDGKKPRPYDFRHHFAYANIESWGREGRNVLSMLPYLAKYMGHSSYDSTYYYVHTSPDFMAEYADIIKPRTSILPEVGFNE